jgi:ectoine hydroxylase-related dioxygenase (phytanoyl-CoA dioxygenase family)
MPDYSELARQFTDKGFLVVEHFFTPAKISEIEAELAQYVEQLSETGAIQSAVYEPQQPGKQPQIRNLFHMEKYSEYFTALAKAPELLNLARAIFRDEPVSMGVELFGKPARVGSVVPFHQDNAYFNLTPDDALTVWVALADVTEANGCVRYLGGTHKLGNLPHRPSGVKGNSMVLCELPAGDWQETRGLIRRGDAIIHHCNTIHRSDPNQSEYDRPGLLFVYKSIRCHIDEPRARVYREISALAAKS